MVRHNREGAPGQTLDVPEIAALLGAAEGERDAGRPGPGGPPDAMDIALRHVRDLEIDDMGDAVDIDAPGVLGNDTGPSGAALTATIVSGPSHGQVLLDADGSSG
jgi:hypothetical protein